MTESSGREWYNTSTLSTLEHTHPTVPLYYAFEHSIEYCQCVVPLLSVPSESLSLSVSLSSLTWLESIILTD